MNTKLAVELIQAVAASGVRVLVFAGGDPSIRPDIVNLIDLAHSLGLLVEVQTNAHSLRGEFLQALKMVSLVGLSLDGPDRATHDTFRGRNGNFDRVLDLLNFLAVWRVPVAVRTIVAKPNYLFVTSIGDILARFKNLVRWSLLEFSAVGQGFVNRDEYELESSAFEEAATQVVQSFACPSKVDVYRAGAKVGAYILITPAGLVYTTCGPLVGGFFPTVGSVVEEHLSVLASRLQFSRENHLRRYGEELWHVKQISEAIQSSDRTSEEQPTAGIRTGWRLSRPEVLL